MDDQSKETHTKVRHEAFVVLGSAWHGEDLAQGQALPDPLTIHEGSLFFKACQGCGQLIGLGLSVTEQGHLALAGGSCGTDINLIRGRVDLVQVRAAKGQEDQCCVANISPIKALPEAGADVSGDGQLGLATRFGST